jgi:hypothetical protein
MTILGMPLRSCNSGLRMSTIKNHSNLLDHIAKISASVSVNVSAIGNPSHL